MKYELISILFLSVIIMTSMVLSYTSAHSQTTNDTLVPTNTSNNQNLLGSNMDSIQRIVQQNSDGKLDVSISPFSNETATIKNGTLIIDKAKIPIKYEQIGPLKILSGDMLLPTQIVNGRAAVDKFITSSKWTNGNIPIVIDSNFPNQDRITDALSYVQSLTPIRFVNVKYDLNNNILDTHYLRFIDGGSNGCFTFPGMVSPNDPLFTQTVTINDKRIDGFYGDNQYHGQPIVISDWCKFGNVVHEIGHVLGLWHEQTRCDREQYVEIDEDNIKEDKITQYIALCDPSQPTLSPTSLGTNYDYCSIEHYPGKGGNAIDPNKPIMTPKYEVKGSVIAPTFEEIPCTDIGQRDGFSPTDLSAIKKAYSFVRR